MSHSVLFDGLFMLLPPPESAKLAPTQHGLTQDSFGVSVVHAKVA